MFGVVFLCQRTLLGAQRGEVCFDGTPFRRTSAQTPTTSRSVFDIEDVRRHSNIEGHRNEIVWKEIFSEILPPNAVLGGIILSDHLRRWRRTNGPDDNIVVDERITKVKGPGRLRQLGRFLRDQCHCALKPWRVPGDGGGRMTESVDQLIILVLPTGKDSRQQGIWVIENTEDVKEKRRLRRGASRKLVLALGVSVPRYRDTPPCLRLCLFSVPC